jgi:hypothetical protein
MMKLPRVLLFGLSLAAGGCILHGSSPYPLTPDGEERPDDQVGVLIGPIAVVDGQSVSDKGRTFALLPGCHSFRLLRTVGQVEANGGGYVTTLPQKTLSIQVEPGHYYTLETTFYSSSAPVNSGTLGISDHRRDGSVTAALSCRASS